MYLHLSGLKDFYHIYTPRQIIRFVHTLAELSHAACLSQLRKLSFLEDTILNLTTFLKLLRNVMKLGVDKTY
jgi:hypothetical protein